MDQPLLAFAIKLPLALAVFLLIASAGTVNKRIAGVLLTFPILNGVAVITAADPVRVAGAIYPLVIFNCVLFVLVISFPHRLPPLDTLPRPARLLARVLTWGVAWFVGAYVITDVRDAIPDGTILFPATAIFAVLFMILTWTKQSSAPTRVGGYRLSDFISFWASGTGLTRIALFVFAYAVLFFAARAALDEKWVGMASALPLPGFFALAALIEDVEADASREPALLPMRDTVFLGPVLVIPFNAALAHALVAMPDVVAPRYLLLLALWAMAALTVLVAVPKIAAVFDRRSPN